MQQNIEVTKQIRDNFIRLLQGLSIEQLNKVPQGFNNNLIWNFGHIIVSQQNLTYKICNLPSVVDSAIVAKYSKGTRPEGIISEQEFELLQQLAISTLDRFTEDNKQGIFAITNPYKTSSGLVLQDIDIAIRYNMIHENLHYGFCLAMKKLV